MSKATLKTNRRRSAGMAECEQCEALPVMKVGVDMRLTTAEMARLAPEQIDAVYEGVGRLVAAGLGASLT